MIGASSYLFADKEYRYSYLPKKIYENQLFPITLLEIGSNKVKPKFYFEKSKKSKPIFKNPLVVKNGNDTFYTFYFKATEKSFYLPALTIKDGKREIELKGREIEVVKLKYRDDFSGVLAADMKIKTSQASTYDEKNNLVTISIEAFEANIEDMYLDLVVEDGVENIKRKSAKVVAEYYAVVPTTKKHLRFTYFNTIKGQYQFLDTPIVIKDYSVSTQSEINPKDDSFDKLKKIIFLILSILFFLLFLWKRDFFYLVLVVFTVAVLLVLYTPKKKICVKEGAPLYILPTYTSSISTKIDSDFITPLLGKRAEFNKIEYKNNIIGWIKDENLCKD
jgi:hypothetical protein